MNYLILGVLIIASVVNGADFRSVATLPDRAAIDFFVQNGGGLVRPKDWLYDNTEWINIQPRRALPSSYDLRTTHPSGHLHPIKRQQCGDCWAHSVITVFENQWALAHPTEIFSTFAQQELISSCGNTGGSCNGGFFTAFNYVIGKTGAGLPLDGDLPYQGHGTSCNHSVVKAPRGYSWAYVGKSSTSSGPTIDQMKEALLQHGTLSVSVHAFNTTGSGIYTACSPGMINHMVNIEGWVDDSSVNGGGYWIMRNSWGPSFGEAGYAKVAFKNRWGGKCSSLGQETAVLTRLE